MENQLFQILSGLSEIETWSIVIAGLLMINTVLNFMRMMMQSDIYGQLNRIMRGLNIQTEKEEKEEKKRQKKGWEEK